MGCVTLHVQSYNSWQSVYTHSRGYRDVRFGPKVGQIAPKWDKSGTFSDQISVHFGLSQNVLKSDLKKLSDSPLFRANLSHFGAKMYICVVSAVEMSLVVSE